MYIWIIIGSIIIVILIGGILESYWEHQKEMKKIDMDHQKDMNRRNYQDVDNTINWLEKKIQEKDKK